MSVYLEVPREEIPNILKDFEKILGCNGYNFQVFKTKEGWIYQVTKGAKVLGMGATINLTMTPQDEGVHVAFSEGKWADKALAGGIGFFFLWPLSITSAVGCYRQSQMQNNIVNFLNQVVGKFYAHSGN